MAGRLRTGSKPFQNGDFTGVVFGGFSDHVIG